MYTDDIRLLTPDKNLCLALILDIDKQHATRRLRQIITLRDKLFQNSNN